jgi:myo-inositol-1(or 4)-monophosphatase
MTEDFSSLLETAHHAALAAGQVLRDFLGRPRDVHKKGFRDFVTDADFAAQEAILSLIRERHPTHHILAEEGSEGTTIPDGTTWIIDPVDGTTNYTLGIPIFNVSIGVARDGQPVAGVIYDPLQEEIFAGAKGGGATLNGNPLPRLEPVALEDAVVGVDWAHAPADRAQTLAVLNVIAPRCRTVRALGSAALALAYVAAGRLHLYFHVGLWPWDTAAGTVLIGEVGGAVRCPDGTPWGFECTGIAAGHPELLTTAAAIIHG